MPQSFNSLIADTSPAKVAARIEAVSTAEVKRALACHLPGLANAPALFSPAAQSFLEEMAVRARAITQARFGRTMTLYSPIYLSNYCVNRCAYCGFAAHRTLPRKRLSLDEAVAPAGLVMDQGVRHLLLVTGEAPAEYGLDEICAVVRHIRERAASVAVEIFPCDQKQYQRLIDAGVDGLVLYQETYDVDVYQKLHLDGPKKDFDARLTAIEAGGAAGFRSLGIGSLMGLASHRVEAFYLAWHCHYLMRRFPHSKLAISFPRLRPVKDGTSILHKVNDADLAQLIVAMRLLYPDVEIVLSTRESAFLRDHLIHLGVTRMSAGSRTSPGGYGPTYIDHESGQFETDDRRDVAEVMAAIHRQGFDVVTKDFDPAFLGNGGKP